MTTKGSKTTAYERAEIEVSIRPEQTSWKVTSEVLPINAYHMILGIPFMHKHQAKLDVAYGTIFFPTLKYTLRCSRQPMAASLIPKHLAMATQPLKKETPTHALGYKPDSERKKNFLLNYHDGMGYFTETDSNAFNIFKEAFPNVFPEQPPVKLPPLRPGCNHKVEFLPNADTNFTIPNIKTPE